MDWPLNIDDNQELFLPRNSAAQAIRSCSGANVDAGIWISSRGHGQGSRSNPQVHVTAQSARKVPCRMWHIAQGILL
jgi:hypothetical protein